MTISVLYQFIWQYQKMYSNHQKSSITLLDLPVAYHTHHPFIF